MPGSKVLEYLQSLPLAERNQRLAALQSHGVTFTPDQWWLTARASQFMPQDSALHLYMAGRGVGKTRTGVNTILDMAARGVQEMAMVAASSSDLRRVLISGPVGLMPEAAKRGWKLHTNYGMGSIDIETRSGHIAHLNLFSAQSPERLRGPQHEFAFCDEVGSWEYEETWSNLLLGMRVGNPRILVCSTPRNTPLMQQLLNDATTIQRETTRDNAANLPASTLAAWEAKYAGTRIGRQELEGEFLGDVEGALFSESQFKQCAGNHSLDLIAVGIDPALSGNDGADETGIVVVGMDRAGNLHILGDYSGTYAPDAVVAKACAAAKVHNADKAVVEVNQGGDWVSTRLAADLPCPLQKKTATKSKAARLVDAVCLAEQGKIFVCYDDSGALVTQAANWVPNGTKLGSPDRLDALAWALSAVQLGEPTRIFQHMPLR